MFLWLNLLGAALNFILNYALIPNFGIKGAACATLISSIIVFSFYIYISQLYYRVEHRWLPILSMVVLVVLVAALSNYVDTKGSYQLGLKFFSYHFS